MSSKFQKVLIIALCWTLIQVVTYISTYSLIEDLIAMDRLQGSYDFWPDFVGNLVIGIIGGLIGGYFLVYRVNSEYRQRTFLSGIVKSGVYFIIIYLAGAATVLFLMTFIYFSITEGAMSAVTRSWNNVVVNLRTPSFFVAMFIWAFIVSGTQFMLQVNDKFGPGVLWKFLTGKYYHPQKVDRIFMFLDLRGSTSIAEQIGHVQFFSFLKDMYRDITDPVMRCGGEIYQYIGDEVVITWPVTSGSKAMNCIHCFFSIRQALALRNNYYHMTYGVIPHVKAGIHMGEATLGEIGQIKKDLVYLGDVLNTTSRIQGECNKYGVDLLISPEICEMIPENAGFLIISIGQIGLRGKTEDIPLYSVSESIAQSYPAVPDSPQA